MWVMSMRVEQTGKYISVLYRLITKHMQVVLKQFGLNNIDYTYLMILLDRDSQTLEELTTLALVDKSQTTRAVQSLLSKGLVVKQCNPNDKRSFLVSLTDEGKKVAPMVKEEIINMEMKLNDGFDRTKQRELKRDLIHMIKNIKE